MSCLQIYYQSFDIFELFRLICDAYLSLHIFEVCKTIVGIYICNRQLKIWDPLIFDGMVVHLAITNEWGTVQVKYEQPTYLQLSLFHMWMTTTVLETLNMQKDM